MHIITSLIASNLFIAIAAFVVAFFILNKCADWFVDAAVGMAVKFHIPKLIIGIILVSLATTAPELAVSLMSAIRGSPEIALGNAIGSVICDDGLALGLAGILAASPILIMPSVLKTSGLFLLLVEIIAFLFVFRDFTLEGWEGGILLALFAVYIIVLFRQREKGFMEEREELAATDETTEYSVLKLVLFFFIGLAGIIFSSEIIVSSAVTIAKAAHIPESVIALTLIALGTSIPEVATCIIAARKNQGAIAVGNIIGADIMNICWVAGASALANDLVLNQKQIYFMFPSMFIIVGAMLIMLRINYRLTKAKGFILIALYLIYLGSFAVIFPVR